MTNILGYVSAGAGTFLVGIIFMQWLNIGTLEDKVTGLEEAERTLIKELVLENANYVSCTSTVDMQNAKIEKFKSKIANFKPKTVIDTVYKYLPADINLERGDCNDTKTVIDFMRNNPL